jgi:hypothetical protein
MNEHHPTRREVLRGMAAVHLVEDTLKAQAGDSSVCFMSTVEMAGLIRTKKLSARGRPSPTKQRRPVLVRIDPSPFALRFSPSCQFPLSGRQRC